MPLPEIPKHVAVITSRTSDARADIQRIAHDRFPGLRMTIIHAIVQGGQAAASISRAISRACDLAEGQGLEEGEPPVDVIIVGRGGGSATDLWAFNLEPVAWEDSGSESLECLCRSVDVYRTPCGFDPSHRTVELRKYPSVLYREFFWR